jgi:glycerophosphoryl diester phosphodiesterase
MAMTLIAKSFVKHTFGGILSGLFWLAILSLLVQASFERTTKPIVIAHRGASGYIVEHSEGAKVLAHAQGADFIEQDVVMTKDLQFIVTHDITMEETTDVETIFADRCRADGKWYFVDFTWEEIQKLTLHERTRKGSQEQAFANRFPGGFGQRVLRLEDEIRLIQGLDRTTGRTTGLYIELKLLKRLQIDQAKDHCYIQCFELDELMCLHNDHACPLPLVYLIGKSIQPDEIKELRPAISGLGPSLELVAKRNADGTISSTGLVEAAHEVGLLVHPYTVRKESQPRWSQSLDQTHQVLIDQLGVDGFFSDFPDTARRAVDAR